MLGLASIYERIIGYGVDFDHTLLESQRQVLEKRANSL